MTNETLTHDNRDSITLKKNAKGEYAWDIKRYYDFESSVTSEIVDSLVVTDHALRMEFL